MKWKAFSSPPKTNNGNIEDEMEKEHKMGEMNGCESCAIGIEIGSSKTMFASNEQCTGEFHMFIGGEEEKENMKRDMSNEKIGEVEDELTSFDSMNGEESICILGGKEKDDLTKETNVVIAHEEEKELPMEEFNDEKDPDEELIHVEDEKEEVKNDEEDPDEELIYVEAENEEVKNEEDEMEEVKNEEDEMEEVKNEEDEMEELKNEEQVEVISKKKIARSKKKKGKKGSKKTIALKAMNQMIAKDTNDQEPSNKNLQMVELNNKEKVNDEVVHEKNVKGEVKNEERVEDISQKKVGKLRKKGRKGSKKKMALKVVNEVIVKDTNAKEPSNKKATTNAKVTGMIFMCSSKTKKDCYHYKILGLPANKRDIVLKICEGMKLFLFDFDLKLLYGIYKATGPGGYNIEPKAFKSAFPSQVRFNVHEDCLPLPEEKFKNVIKDNYYQKNKFDCQLTSEQVKNLCKLFQAASTKSKGLRRNPEAQIRTFTDRDGSKKHRHRAETQTFADQDRTKKRRHVAETYTSANRDRTRKRRPRAETHIFPDRERTRKRRRDAYERETYASPVAPLPSRAPLPPPSALAFPPRSYAYEGSLEMNVYRRDPLVEHQDIRYRDLELRHRDHIEQARDSFHEHHDGRFLDSELRHRGEIEHRDRYARYRDFPLHHDLSYSVAQPSEYLSHLRTPLHPLARPQSTSLYDHYAGTRSRY